MRVPRALVMMLAGAIMIVPTIAFANVAPPDPRQELRKQVSGFFAQVDESSPAALGAVKKSPEAMKAIQKRIDAMSGEELVEFQKMLGEAPNPDDITKMLSPEAMKAIQAAGADYTARAPQAERMRNDVGTLTTVLKMLPDEKLKEMGLDRSMVASLETAFSQMSPLQAGVMQKQLAGNSQWEAKSAAAIQSLPPALQRGAAALSRHGPITAEEVTELEKFRSEVVALLDRVDALPAETRKQLKIEGLRAQIAKIGLAPPDVLFMIRHELTPAKADLLDENLTLLERLAKLSDNDREELEGFRNELTDTFKGLRRDGIDQKLAELTPEQLMLFKDRMPDFQQWKTVAAPMFGALTSPGLAQRIEAVQGASPDPARMAALEGFRRDALAYIDAAAAEGADGNLVSRARQVVAEAPLPKLEFVRTLVENMPPEANAEARLRAVSNVELDCVVSLGSIHIDVDPVIDVDIGLGSINFNFACDPIEDALNAVGTSISRAVDSIEDTLRGFADGVRAGLQTLLDGISATVTSVVGDIVAVVEDVLDFVQTIPSLAKAAIEFAINALLDLDIPGLGMSLRELIAGGIGQVVPRLQQALNIGANFWNSLNDILPQLPCPDDGFSTPFGTVGTGEAVVKYNRYKFFLDAIVGMIPDTEISLSVKIPVQVLYSAFDYLGVCLADAAAARDSLEATNRHTTVTAGLTTVFNDGNDNTILLSQQLTTAFNNLGSSNTNQDASFRLFVTGHVNSLTNLLTTSTNNLTSLINSKTSDLTTLINDHVSDLTELIDDETQAAEDLQLRLHIELNLQANIIAPLAAFQLPRANGGYLELVRDVVNSSINSMLAAGQSIFNAQRYYSDGVASLNQGQYRSAFRSFQNAYKELTKVSGG